MVGLVSAFGGKFGFSIFCFKKETLIKHLFRELYKRPTDTLVGSDFLRILCGVNFGSGDMVAEES